MHATEPPVFSPVHTDPRFSIGRYPDRPFLVALRLGAPNINLIQQDGLCDLRLRFDVDTLGRLAASWTDATRSHFQVDVASGTWLSNRIVSTLYREGADIYWGLNCVSFWLGSVATGDHFGLHPQMVELLLPTTVMDRSLAKADRLVRPRPKSPRPLAQAEALV